MSNLSVLDVQKHLARLRDAQGIDLTHSKGMANLYGKLYPIIGINMSITSPMPEHEIRGGIDTEWHIPLENKHVVVGHHSTSSNPQDPHDKTPFYNVQQPGSHQYHPGLGGGRHWSLSYPEDSDGIRERIGPVSVTREGSLDTGGRTTIPRHLRGKSFHDLVAHAATIPSNVGAHIDYHSYPGREPFSEKDIKNFNIREAIETEVRNSIYMDMPKGQEHNIAIAHFFDPSKPNAYYVYNPHTEQLLPSTSTKLGKNG